jgi:hypothetical protein
MAGLSLNCIALYHTLEGGMKKILFLAVVFLLVMSFTTSVASAERGVFGKHWMENTIHKLVTSSAYDPSDSGNSPGWKAWAKKWLVIYKRTTIKLNGYKSSLDLPLSRCVLKPDTKPTTWHELGALYKRAVNKRDRSIDWCKWAVKWKGLALERVANANNRFKAESAKDLGWAYKKLANRIWEIEEDLGYVLKN